MNQRDIDDDEIDINEIEVEEKQLSEEHKSYSQDEASHRLPNLERELITQESEPSLF